MPACHVTISTDHASKYLQQLCKHFAHKVDVNYDKEAGFAALPPGPCTLKASATELYIYCQSDKTNALPISRSIVETHLVKFAWRENLTIIWQDCPDLEEQKKEAQHG
ncbi:MAG: DUF2218 domain-containing protein [Methylocystaceae bacterium]|nr:DUF2218 domain-containing protein [Methylocystaceae bacterium]